MRAATDAIQIIRNGSLGSDGKRKFEALYSQHRWLPFYPILAVKYFSRAALTSVSIKGEITIGNKNLILVIARK